jgi:hypothetical protein
MECAEITGVELGSGMDLGNGRDRRMERGNDGSAGQRAGGGSANEWRKQSPSCERGGMGKRSLSHEDGQRKQGRCRRAARVKSVRARAAWTSRVRPASRGRTAQSRAGVRCR